MTDDKEQWTLICHPSDYEMSRIVLARVSGEDDKLWRLVVNPHAIPGEISMLDPDGNTSLWHKNTVSAEEYNSLRRERDELRAEVERLRSASVTEIAAVNQSVMEYCDHWEARTERAEARVTELERIEVELKGVVRRLLVYLELHKQQHPNWNGNRADDERIARAALDGSETEQSPAAKQSERTFLQHPGDLIKDVLLQRSDDIKRGCTCEAGDPDEHCRVHTEQILAAKQSGSDELLEALSHCDCGPEPCTCGDTGMVEHTRECSNCAETTLIGYYSGKGACNERKGTGKVK